MNQAQIIVTNYHAFLLKDAKEIRGVASNTRKLLAAGKKRDPFRESPAAMASRVLRDFNGAGNRKGRGKQEIVVLNDEAHHCYQDKPVESVVKLSREQQVDVEEARVWFRGVQAVARQVGVKDDLRPVSYTVLPGRFGAPGRTHLPMDGQRLLPHGRDRVRGGEDPAHRSTTTPPTSWSPTCGCGTSSASTCRSGRRRRWPGRGSWIPPTELEGALHTLFRSYRRSYDHWRDELEQYGETPPVFIVVCPNTVVSKLVYDWVAGAEVERPDGTTVIRPGRLDLFSNYEDGAAVGNDPYKRLKVALKADIDADAWATMHATTSRPFDEPDTGKVAVKVINDYGDEVMKVFEV